MRVHGIAVLAAARSSDIRSDIRSEMDQCFLSWLTLVDIPAAVDAAMLRVLEELVRKHIHPQQHGSVCDRSRRIRKADFQGALSPLLRRFATNSVCLRDKRTLTAMMRVIRLCAPFFNDTLGNRLFHYLERIVYKPTLLAELGCSDEDRAQIPLLLLEVMRVATLSPRVVESLPGCVERIAVSTGDFAIRHTLPSVLAAHAA